MRNAKGQFVSTNPNGSRWDELAKFRRQGDIRDVPVDLRNEELLKHLVKLVSRGTLTKAINASEKELGCGYCGWMESYSLIVAGDWPRCLSCGGC